MSKAMLNESVVRDDALEMQQTLKRFEAKSILHQFLFRASRSVDS